MEKYNLERLGWFNFEQLSDCLLREIVGTGVSTFSGSSDEGRDATRRRRINFEAVKDGGCDMKG